MTPSDEHTARGCTRARFQHTPHRPGPNLRGMLHDAFISHASEDKDAFVRPLAHRLRDAHIDV